MSPEKIYRSITERLLSNMPSCSNRKVADIEIYCCDQMEQLHLVFKRICASNYT
jgi:hypothetical protein